MPQIPSSGSELNNTVGLCNDGYPVHWYRCWRKWVLAGAVRGRIEAATSIESLGSSSVSLGAAQPPILLILRLHSPASMHLVRYINITIAGSPHAWHQHCN